MDNQTHEVAPTGTTVLVATAPAGFMFIDEAIAQVKQRAACPMGPAVKMLLDAIRTGEPRTWMRHHAGPTLIPPANWADAHIDPEGFAERRRGGICYEGSEYHLHRFLISEDEFGYWLDKVAPITGNAPTLVEVDIVKRRSNGLDYRKCDEPLVTEMRQLIESKGARSVEDAARAVARRATGHGEEASKVKRLAKHYRQAFPA